MKPIEEMPALRVLLIEDEPANRALVRAIVARTKLDDRGEIVLHEAATLADARLILEAQQVDVLLLDVRLPDGNGLDLAAEVRARSEVPGPKIVILSASVLPSERSIALAAGADVFLGKPFSPADLVDVLSRRRPAP